MAIQTWGEYKEVVRRTILKDVDGLVATDEKLLDAARWAFNGLCPHTALMKSTSYTGDGSTYTFTLPADLFHPIEQAGLVLLSDASNNALPSFLKPAYSSFDVAPDVEGSFTVWPTDTLRTGVPVPIGVDLVIRYYALYPYMVDDADLLPIPQWAYAAVAYDIGIHLITAQSWEEAINAGNKTKPDAGQPENNALRQTQKWWMQMYDRELTRYPKQQLVTIPHDKHFKRL